MRTTVLLFTFSTQITKTLAKTSNNKNEVDSTTFVTKVRFVSKKKQMKALEKNGFCFFLFGSTREFTLRNKNSFCFFEITLKKVFVKESFQRRKETKKKEKVTHLSWFSKRKKHRNFSKSEKWDTSPVKKAWKKSQNFCLRKKMRYHQSWWQMVLQCLLVLKKTNNKKNCMICNRFSQTLTISHHGRWACSVSWFLKKQKSICMT